MKYKEQRACCDWPDSEWTTALSAFLTIKALDVYSRMPDDAAVNFVLLNEALL